MYKYGLGQESGCDKDGDKNDQGNSQVQNLLQWFFHDNQIYSTLCTLIKRI